MSPSRSRALPKSSKKSAAGDVPTEVSPNGKDRSGGGATKRPSANGVGKDEVGKDEVGKDPGGKDPGGDSNGRVPEGESWERLRWQVRDRSEGAPASQVLGEIAAGGSAFRWGLAAALGRPLDPLEVSLSRIAVTGRFPGSSTKRGKAKKRPKASDPNEPVDLATAAEQFLDAVTGPVASIHESAEAILWGASMPALIDGLEPRVWWDLLGALLELRNSTLQIAEASAPPRLMLGGELGLILAWRLADLPTCRRLAGPSVAAIDAWFAEESDAIGSAVRGAVDARLVLASVLRCRRLIENTTKRRFKKRQLEIATDLATWVAGMTLPGGRVAFSELAPGDLRDDVGPRGLLRQAVELDPETLRSATSAALGESHSGGRLAWQVSLPEPMLTCETGELAIMMPEWDVRRGRVHIDHRGDELQIELFGGKPRLLSGAWTVELKRDDEMQAPCGPWTQTCEYADDDVQYVELEQTWTGDLVLQRQVMQLRDDRAVLLADAVIAVSDDRDPTPIGYTARLPLDPSVVTSPDPETREIFLTDGKKSRGMVLPLAASEWRVGPTDATLEAEQDALVHRTHGSRRLYAPVWFDLQSRRFKRPRTWRQLTVADELKIVPRHEAVGFRVQLGSEQWMVYRSLGGPRCRTVLGKHLLVDFLCTRFDMGDGTHEDLITVDVPGADE